MAGCQYQASSNLRRAGQDFLIGVGAAARMFETYYPEAHSTLDDRTFVLHATGAVVRTNRHEAYLFDLHSTRKEPVAALIMAAEFDLHRGDVAVPAVCYIHPDYRGVPDVVRWLARQQIYTGRTLGCRWLMHMKHLSDDARLITYKEL
ncbi:hypothetical protein LAh2_44 [Aeromonas phage LAh2]|uniref:Uncharacterized protein n=1 Tax=Aeromonas phage LAh1 TaxID=2591024 RepID=A0A513ZYZ9_9CAUD|nr:hypothetical protein LAh1_44 [Aeromonas phage LAh1]QDH46304.1 hypothetical protein LAh2_44 [Aeromonas phage LAh2]QDH46349.1 hypothetical protein LAh3_49 [Aeromonas phage LAh3]QDH46399.1 hypothetical protein LAh4_51 [Aeromonas phage LAh4]QDH46452.1 hypothetical protein LAh5_53 [Aeromonas phage LAh5]